MDNQEQGRYAAYRNADRLLGLAREIEATRDADFLPTGDVRIGIALYGGCAAHGGACSRAPQPGEEDRTD